MFDFNNLVAIAALVGLILLIRRNRPTYRPRMSERERVRLVGAVTRAYNDGGRYESTL